MNTMYTLIVAIQVITALVIIGLVLVQHGKGADMGAAFGSGASGSLFGATGSASFLSRVTAVAATIFFCVTLALAYLGNRHTAPSGGVMDNLTMQKATEPSPASPPAPAADAAKPAPPVAPSAPSTDADKVNRADQIPK